MKTLRLASTFVACSLFVGCCAFRPKTQTIKIVSDPPGATITITQEDKPVFINGSATAVSPTQADVKRNKLVKIRCEYPDYKTQDAFIDNHLSDMAILDIVGTLFLIVPVAGLFFPGAHDLERTEVEFKLQGQE